MVFLCSASQTSLFTIHSPPLLYTSIYLWHVRIEIKCVCTVHGMTGDNSLHFKPPSHGPSASHVLIYEVTLLKRANSISLICWIRKQITVFIWILWTNNSDCLTISISVCLPFVIWSVRIVIKRSCLLNDSTMLIMLCYMIWYIAHCLTWLLLLQV